MSAWGWARRFAEYVLRGIIRLLLVLLLSIPFVVLYVLFGVFRQISLLSLWRLNPWRKSYGFANVPAAAQAPDRLSGETKTQQSPLLCIAISGGGSRAAILGAAVLFYLQKELDILSKCSYVSAVSGGTLAATSFCLMSDDATRDRERIHKSFKRDFQTPWLVDYVLASPRILATSYNATDVLAETFDEMLFKGATFRSLRSDRPQLLINATVVPHGQPFTFSEEAFAELGSDRSSFRLSHAAAVSCAYPPVFHYGVLKDFKKDRLLYLLDGGIWDNTGVRFLLDYLRKRNRGATSDLITQPVAIIAIDAQVDPSNAPDWTKKEFLSTKLSTVNATVGTIFAQQRQWFETNFTSEGSYYAHSTMPQTRLLRLSLSGAYKIAKQKETDAEEARALAWLNGIGSFGTPGFTETALMHAGDLDRAAKELEDGADIVSSTKTRLNVGASQAKALWYVAEALVERKLEDIRRFLDEPAARA